MTKIRPNSIYSKSDIVLAIEGRNTSVQDVMLENKCVKCRSNQIGNRKSVKFYVDLVFDRRRLKRELVQEMMFVNTCVEFRDNRLRNEVCRAVIPFESNERRYERKYVRAYSYISW